MWGRNTATLPIDRKLLETARDIRATQAGIRPENFREFKVAVARVRIDGRLEYFDAEGQPNQEWSRTDRAKWTPGVPDRRGRDDRDGEPSDPTSQGKRPQTLGRATKQDQSAAESTAGLRK
jgi:hypothetical protein